MKLGFHYHIPAIQKEDGEIWLPGYLGVFIDGLACKCEEIICFLHSPLPSETSLLDYKIKAKNVSLVDIGPHISMFRRALKTKSYAKKIVPYLEQIDILLIRGPSPLLFPFASMCRKNNVAVSYLLVGDYLEGLNSATSMNKIKKSILWAYYWFNKYAQEKDIQKTLVFVNSPKLFEEYKKKVNRCFEVRTTTLRKIDSYKRLDTCENKIVELLYTGRIDPSKGIEDVFYAIAKLKEKTGVYIRLNIVGWETAKGFLDELQVLAKQLDITDNYIFHGKKTVGPELFEMYRKSDIYVLASRGDFEGFPRTLWEAMANSLPIIATHVGGIPYLLKNMESALLVKPNDPTSLSKAIEYLTVSQDVRKTLIVNGYALAQSNTIEAQSENMVKIYKEYLNGE